MEEYSDRTPTDIARFPMVPIRDVVIFPFTKVAFKIGRPGSVRALEMALASDRTIFLSTQHDATVDEPTPDQIYRIGTIARILQSQRQENGQIKVVVEGRERATTIRVDNNAGAFTATIRRAPVASEEGVRTDALIQKIEEAGMTEEAKEKALQELHRLEAMPPMSAEGTVSRTNIDWLVSVPWKHKSKEIRDLTRAEEVLNEDHFGLDKIKDRILEYLAVRQLVKNPKGSILCFVGPPGVGKTSLGKSIARATGRKFVRLSLGGVRDEAEIRGHRRTYIGAL